MTTKRVESLRAGVHRTLRAGARLPIQRSSALVFNFKELVRMAVIASAEQIFSYSLSKACRSSLRGIHQHEVRRNDAEPRIMIFRQA